MTEDLANLATTLPDLARRKLVAFIVSELLEYQDSDIAYDENSIHVVVDRALRFWADWYEAQEDKERINYGSVYTYRPERNKRNNWEAFKEEYKGRHGIYPSDYTIESLKQGLKEAAEGKVSPLDEETLQRWAELEVDFDEEENLDKLEEICTIEVDENSEVKSLEEIKASITKLQQETIEDYQRRTIRNFDEALERIAYLEKDLPEEQKSLISGPFGTETVEKIVTENEAWSYLAEDESL